MSKDTDSEIERMDKSAFSVSSLDKQGKDLEYWRSRSVSERWQALELLRQAMYGYRQDTTRLSRFFEVAKLTRS